MRTLLSIILVGVLAMPALADGFSQIKDKSQFVSLMKGRDLTRFGIRVNVTPDGDIKGRAFGSNVSGEWRWDGSYFCRDLYWGDQNLGANCQAVELKGNTVRFTSDQGRGRHADLYLR
jgi:hypothetical protein